MSINENKMCFYDYYEKEFAKALINKPLRRPWIKEDREEIVATLKDCLNIQEKYIPQIKITGARVLKQDGFRIELIRAESWKNTACSAHLYIPENSKEDNNQRPFVLLCCGHGKGCKSGKGYQAMARRLVKQGAVVLVLDNIGQGERENMGHYDPVLPFACGLSIQSLIVMETMAWIKWAMTDIGIDTKRMAAIGNSGGGMLSLFLAGLCPELSVVSASGYPSSFEYVAKKEKKHCHCNILPGIVSKLEMWEILGVFAPKPLYIFQGTGDVMFPDDIFCSTVRRVKAVYSEMNCEDKFRFTRFEGPHPWYNEKRYMLSGFLAETLGLCPAEILEDDTVECLEETDCACYEKWPENALTTDELAVELTGIRPDPELKLWDVYKPPFDENSYEQSGLRGETRQVFAQYEAFLHG